MPPIRVTRITRGAVIYISRLLSVLVVHFALPVVVADQAGELPKVVWCGVAGLAAVPLAVVGSGEDRKELLVMIRVARSLPRFIGMTKKTCRWKPSTSMLVVIVTLVAGDTIILAGRRENRSSDALVVTARAPNVRMPSE